MKKMALVALTAVLAVFPALTAEASGGDARAGKQVFIVAEASGSRDPANRDLAFTRMRGHGIEIVSREMVAFEWLQRGGTELFREVNRDFIR